MSTSAPRIEREGRRARVSGSLGFPQASDALARVREITGDARGDIDVDVSGIEDVDSATLATLLGWSAAAARAGARLHYVGIPSALASLAKLSDAEALLTGAEPRATQ